MDLSPEKQTHPQTHETGMEGGMFQRMRISGEKSLNQREEKKCSVEEEPKSRNEAQLQDALVHASRGDTDL